MPFDHFAGILVVIALSMVPANALGSLTAEAVSGAKHLLNISGASPSIYWLVRCAFLGDILGSGTGLVCKRVAGLKPITRMLGLLPSFF
jgi:hypothetical protein